MHGGDTHCPAAEWTRIYTAIVVVGGLMVLTVDRPIRYIYRIYRANPPFYWSDSKSPPSNTTGAWTTNISLGVPALFVQVEVNPQGSDATFSYRID